MNEMKIDFFNHLFELLVITLHLEYFNEKIDVVISPLKIPDYIVE